MVLINVSNVLRMLHESYDKSNMKPTSVTEKEVELKDHLRVIIDNFIESTEFHILEQHDLEFQEELQDDEHEISKCMENKENMGSQNSDYVISQEDLKKEMIDNNYKTAAVQFWKSGNKNHKTFSAVKNRYKKVKTKADLYRWEKQLDIGGSKVHKLQIIQDQTLSKYKEAKRLKLVVHDTDLRRWAMQINRSSRLPNFKASRGWAHNFKIKNRIVSRKITRIVSTSHENNKDMIQKSAEDFVDKVIPYVQSHGAENIFNSDQSGFNKELHSGRTLDDKGIKRVEVVVQSVNSTTHSYTIQPTISASGKLLSPLFIVLQEIKGQFGPRVSESVFRPKNVYVECSTSGKLTKNLMKTWFSEVYFPAVGEDSVLLVDSWNSFKDKETIDSTVPDGKKMTLLMIPEHATSIAQPLDVYGFRLWKNFARTISDRVMLDQLDICLYQRNNIIKLQSLIHNQFSSPRYIELFKYGWYRSGYIPNKPSGFLTPNQFCFQLNSVKCSKCEELNFITCSWCEEPLCFDHFFVKYHFCEQLKD